MPAPISDEGKEAVLLELDAVTHCFDNWQRARRVDKVCICETKLYIALTSKWHDLQRMKQFHNFTVPEKCKDASFFTYWMTKIQPVQHTCEFDSHDTGVTKIATNVAFAIHYAMNRVGCGMLAVEPIFLRNLFYTLTFRHVTPEHLALTYTALLLPPPA